MSIGDSNGNGRRQVVPYFGFPSVASLSRAMDRIFDSFFDGFPELPQSRSYLERGDNAYTLSVELPGYDKSEVQVTTNDGCISVKAEHKEKGRESSFRGNFCLPRDAVVPQEITGKLERGILTINFPIDEKARSREVRIE